MRFARRYTLLPSLIPIKYSFEVSIVFVGTHTSPAPKGFGFGMALALAERLIKFALLSALPEDRFGYVTALPPLPGLVV